MNPLNQWTWTTLQERPSACLLLVLICLVPLTILNTDPQKCGIEISGKYRRFIPILKIPKRIAIFAHCVRIYSCRSAK